MQFAREIKRLLLVTLMAFMCIGVTATYWAIVGPATIIQRDDNPRIIEEILRIQRGRIYDRDDRLLAQTITESDETIREYLHESTYSTLGYYSLRYGEGGAESAFNDDLNGITEIDDLDTFFEREILNYVPQGSDVQLTLDLEIQDTLVASMADFRGAGVVMDAQTGAILALASLPTFDPNTLDEDWDDLTEAEGNPFFNRALQGQYQPGGVIYTLWLAEAILNRYDIAQLIANGADTIELGEDTEVDCVLEPDQSDLSMTQAYQFACPVPFVAYNRITPDHVYADLVSTFALDDQVTLTDFPIPEVITSTSGTEATINIDPELLRLRDTLGQGDITVTPLHIAVIMSAITNIGNAPYPTIQEGVRLPDETDWSSITYSQQSIPMMTTATARQLRTVMRSNWQNLQSDTYPEGGGGRCDYCDIFVW